MNFLGETFLEKSFPQTPFKKLSNKKERQRECRFEETKFLWVIQTFCSFKSALSLSYSFAGKFLKVGFGEETFFKKFPPRETSLKK